MKFMTRLNEVAVKTFCFGLTEMSSVTPFDRQDITKQHKHVPSVYSFYPNNSMQCNTQGYVIF